jgi:predicted ATPase/Tfp pilus assembly protein PilF
MKFSGKSEPQAELAAFLHDQQRLLVLDNFEPLLPNPAATDLLLDLIQAASGLQLLVTSREALNLRAEWLYELAGLPFPPAEPHSIEIARSNLPERFASVRLFTQHAHRLHRDFAAGPSEQTAISQLCRLVEGMPLAIELAAALTRTHTCAEIAAAAQHNLDSLTTAQHDVPGRHHSLRALFDYSWALLNGRARSALSRLAVFRAGLTADAAGQVAEAGESDLNLLANKSFLRRRPDGRYEMHEVLRQYAAEKLAEIEAVEIVTRHRHADYFTRWVQRHEAALSGETMAESTLTIQAEIDNVRAAWRWAVEHCDLVAIARSMAGLARFYVLKSLTREGEVALRAAIHAVRARLAVGQPGLIAVALFDGPEEDQPAEAVLAALLIWHGRLLARSAQPEAAAAALAESIRLAPGGHGRRAQAMAYLLWGSLDVARSDYTAARRKAEQALSLAQAAGWQKMEADANRLLGNIFGYQGDLPRSRQYYERCLELERVVGQRRGTSATLSNLGSLCLEQGDTAAAEDYFEQALAIHRELDDQSSLAQTLVNLGRLWEVRGDYVQAQHCHAESLQITRLIGDRQHEPDAVLHLGLVALGQDQPAAAQPHLDNALSLYRTAGDRWGEAAVLEAQGNLAEAQGLPGPALEALQAALAVRRSIVDHAGIASAQAELGRLSASQGHIVQAHAYLSAALETARTTRATVLLLRVMVAIAVLLARTGRPARALEVLVCVLPHPSLESKTRILANREWANVAGLVTEPALAAARARGGQLQPETLAPALLIELAGYIDGSPA